VSRDYITGEGWKKGQELRGGGRGEILGEN